MQRHAHRTGYDRHTTYTLFLLLCLPSDNYVRSVVLKKGSNRTLQTKSAAVSYDKSKLMWRTWRLLPGTIVNGTYGLHKNLHISLFLLTIFGAIDYDPPQYYNCATHIPHPSISSTKKRPLLNPFSTAVPNWGQTSLIPGDLSPKRHCGNKRVNPFRTPVPFWGQTTQIQSTRPQLSRKRDCSAKTPPKKHLLIPKTRCPSKWPW